MKSLGDPVLDAKALCQEPIAHDDLLAKLIALGWHPTLAANVIMNAVGVYFTLGEDGLYRAREGTIMELVEKTLGK